MPLRNGSQKSGILISKLAFLPSNPVPGLNHTCPSSIPIAFGNSPERKFCVPVSVRSSPVAKVILPSSILPDIFAKYNPVKLDTLPLVTRLKLFMMPCPEIVLPMLEYITSRHGNPPPHHQISVHKPPVHIQIPPPQTDSQTACHHGVASAQLNAYTLCFI